jgi:hypothetical protein
MNAFYRAQRGNVLFLILIAVALFAALSYAVTQSTQSNSGKSVDEDALINAAQLTQYATTISAELMRMQIRQVEVQNFQFNPPDDFGNLTLPAYGVFTSGGTTYQKSAPTIMADGLQGTWYFNADFEVKDVGTSIAGNFNGNEITAFLPGVKQTVCQKIDTDLGIGTIPQTAATAYYTTAMNFMDNTYTLPATELVIGDTVMPQFAGFPYGCYHETTSDLYIYYHVLIER